MLFEDLDTLNEMIDLIRSGADNRHQNKDNKAKTSRRFRDVNVSSFTSTHSSTNHILTGPSLLLWCAAHRSAHLSAHCSSPPPQDPEIDRLYSTSPPESEQVGTFELDHALLSEFQTVTQPSILFCSVLYKTDDKWVC